MRDADLGVRIDFIVTGNYLGNGKPKPVAFPDPSVVAIETNTVRVISLPILVELKLASGADIERAKDIGDVVELIKALRLARDFADIINPYVRDAYLRLWDAVNNAPPDPQEQG